MGVIVHLLGTLVSLWPNRSRIKNSKTLFWEPISILKPLKGYDSGLEENLRTFLQLDYPSYEILLSVATVEDQAYLTAKRLIETNPHVAATLIVDPTHLGPNPKVNNMVKAYETAKNDLILISDSNVRVEKDYLKRLSRYTRDREVGMVTATVSGTKAKGLGGKLEAVFLNSFYARWMKFLFFVGKPCVVGKSMLFRKSVAQRFGGISILSRYLAEDYMAGEAVKRLGLKVILAEDPVPQIIGHLKFKDFWSRHIRWGRIRKSQAFIAFMVEPFLLSTVSSILGCLVFKSIFHLSALHFFTWQMIFWFVCEIPTLIKSRSKITLEVMVIWLLRELLAFPLWIHIAIGNTVQWRGKKLKIEVGGLLAPDSLI